MNIIGSKVSLISKSEIRYEGILYTIDTKESTVALQNVRSFGTEGRKKDGEQIPPSNEVYDYIIFRGSDIKDIRVSEGPQPVAAQPPRPNDPAIIAMPATQAPNMYGSYGQYPMNYQGYPNPNAFNPYGYTYFGSYPMQPQTQPPQQQQAQARPPAATQPTAMAPQPAAPQAPTQVPSTPSPQVQQPVSREEPKPVQTPPAQTPQVSQQLPHSSQSQQEQPGAPAAPTQNTQSDSERYEDSRGPSDRNFQGGNRGRRGGYSGAPSRGGFQQNNTRGRRPPQGGARAPTKFSEDFDFEGANAKFDKEKISTEVQAPITPYDNSSFFDSISCEATDRLKEGRDKQRASLAEQRKLDTETFGTSQTDRRYPRGRGRYNPSNQYSHSTQNTANNTSNSAPKQQQQQQNPSQRVFRPVNTGNERGGSRPRGRNPPNNRPPTTSNTQ